MDGCDVVGAFAFLAERGNDLGSLCELVVEELDEWLATGEETALLSGFEGLFPILLRPPAEQLKSKNLAIDHSTLIYKLEGSANNAIPK